jgi:glyoxylase-like metal-dependent hydrolase (beta-lactamase superfamily II)
MTTQLDFNITQLDTGLMGPNIVACYLIEGKNDEGNSEYAIIETGNYETTTHLINYFKQQNISKNSIRYIIPTHVHLDHAGGASSLMEALPDAKLVMHPKGARHMIDPSKLIAGATAVYGEVFFKKMYGEIKPVPEHRVIIAEDNTTLSIGNRELLFRDTPGHANHHFCIWDKTSQGWFTGDTFGLAYPSLNTDKGHFMFPTTSPVQFDPKRLISSIDLLMSQQPKYMYLTHFGRIKVNQSMSSSLVQQINSYVEIIESVSEDERTAEHLETLLTDYTTKLLVKHGCELSSEDMNKALRLDLKLNSQGLVIWYERANKPQS